MHDISTCSDATSRTTSPFAKQTDSAEEYQNPLERLPRWCLSANAYAIRLAASLGFSLANRSAPAAPTPTRVAWLDSTLGEWKGRKKIRVEIWALPHDPAVGCRAKRPAVINFHGGGFVLGQGTDDARWAGAVMAATNAVVFSVNYRLAPGYPFPTPVEDCADAILQICSGADEFGIDTDRIILSGFSAGGTLALASWVLLQDPRRWGYQIPPLRQSIAGLALFYPALDRTISRQRQRQSCTRPDLTLSKYLTNLFDASYMCPPSTRTERDDPRLSPGLMPDKLVDRLPPIHLCLCEYDMLFAEGLRFADRLKARGIGVGVSVVKGEQHAWDKPPSLVPKESVGVEYRKAVEAIKEWLERTNYTHDFRLASLSSTSREHQSGDCTLSHHRDNSLPREDHVHIVCSSQHGGKMPSEKIRIHVEAYECDNELPTILDVGNAA